MPERILPALVQRAGAGHCSRELVEVAYRDYGRHYDQSLERILRRGGFSWAEIAYQLYAEVVRLEQGEKAARALRFEDHVATDRDRG